MIRRVALCCVFFALASFAVADVADPLLPPAIRVQLDCGEMGDYNFAVLLSDWDDFMGYWDMYGSWAGSMYWGIQFGLPWCDLPGSPLEHRIVATLYVPHYRPPHRPPPPPI